MSTHHGQFTRGTAPGQDRQHWTICYSGAARAALRGRPEASIIDMTALPNVCDDTTWRK